MQIYYWLAIIVDEDRIAFEIPTSYFINNSLYESFCNVYFSKHARMNIEYVPKPSITQKVENQVCTYSYVNPTRTLLHCYQFVSIACSL